MKSINVIEITDNNNGYLCLEKIPLCIYERFIIMVDNNNHNITTLSKRHREKFTNHGDFLHGIDNISLNVDEQMIISVGPYRIPLLIRCDFFDELNIHQKLFKF